MYEVDLGWCSGLACAGELVGAVSDAPGSVVWRHGGAGISGYSGCAPYDPAIPNSSILVRLGGGNVRPTGARGRTIGIAVGNRTAPGRPGRRRGLRASPPGQPRLFRASERRAGSGPSGAVKVADRIAADVVGQPGDI